MSSQQEQAKWTPEYRAEWNRQYRKRIKDGQHVPKTRKATKTVAEKKEARRLYDRSRKEKLKEQRREERLEVDTPKPVNFHKEDKEEILRRLINALREGKEATHPIFELTLKVKDSAKRRSSKGKE